MNLKRNKYSSDFLFPLLLLLIFCLFSLFLAGTGSAVYKNGMAHLDENYTSRTAIAYLTEKVRQHDRSGDIFLTEVEDLPAIGFCDTVEEEDFVTYVYFYQGALCELFVRDTVTPLADMGSRLIELVSFDFEQVPAVGSDRSHLLSATAVSHENSSLSALIPLRSK